MSVYEIAMSCIAATNLLLTLSVMLANRSKAAAARVDELREAIDAGLAALDRKTATRGNEFALRLERLDALVAQAPKHEDLSTIYESLNATRQQVERLSGEVKGEMTQMNANLRMVLNQLMKTL